MIVIETKTAQQLGEAFATGCLIALSKFVLFLVVFNLIFMCLRNVSRSGVDDTDKDGWHRSGLRLYTDNKTGVQYLSDGKGGLTPRILCAPKGAAKP